MLWGRVASDGRVLVLLVVCVFGACVLAVLVLG